MNSGNQSSEALPLVPSDLHASPSLPSRRGGANLAPAKIALFGLFGCGNFGNDGSLEAMLSFLRRCCPGSELVCICADPDIVGERHRIAAVPISACSQLQGAQAGGRGRLSKLARKLFDPLLTLLHLRHVDVMIIPGTGILDDFGERPYGMPWDVLRWCLGARLVGARIAFVSIGAGPIGHPLSRWLMTAAAQLAQYRSYRDTLSKDFMTSAGLDTRLDPVCPDIAFKLPAPDRPRRAVTAEGCLTVGIGVMSYYGWYGFAEGGSMIYQTYIRKLARFAVHVLDRGHDVRILIGETTDQSAVDDLVGAIRASRPQLPAERIIAEPARSLRDVMQQMSRTDLIVATRFHNIVCALKLGIPAISLGYSKKNDVLMAEMGLAAFCQHIEQFDLASLIEQFDALCGRRAEYADMLQGRRQLMEERLERQESFLLRSIL